MAPDGSGLTPSPRPFGLPPWNRRARRACGLALRAVALCALAGLLAAPAASASRAAHRLITHPRIARLANGPLVIKDAALQKQLSPSDFWGGTYTTSTNERVTIFTSRTYPVDDS